jgi:hypothetical protein
MIVEAGEMMDDLNGCTHFKCPSCEKICPIKQMKTVKCLYTVFDYKSITEHRYAVYHVGLCQKCYEEVE